MADRTVDLVIRAKNEATAVLQQITASLENFTKAQSGLVAGSNTTGTALERLVGSLANVAQGVKNLNEFGRVQAEMDKLAASAGKLGADAGAASIEANRLAASLAVVGRQQADADARTKAATAALKEQTAVVQANERAQKSLDNQLKATVTGIERLDAKARNREPRANGALLTNSEQDARTQLESRQTALESLAGTQAIRTDEAVAALGPLQAEERAASAASGALAAQFVNLRRDMVAATATADSLAARSANVAKELNELRDAAAGVGERLGVDATKAESYAQSLATIAGAQQKVTLAIERNKEAQAAADRPGANLTAFRSAIKADDTSAQAATLRDQRLRVDAAERAREIAQSRATAAGSINARVPNEENARQFDVSRLDLDTAEKTLEAERKTLAEIKTVHGQYRAELSEQAAKVEAARKEKGQKEADAILASIDAVIRAQEKALGIANEAAEKEAERIRQQGVKEAQARLKAAEANLKANPPVVQQATGNLAPGVASETTANYRLAISSLADYKAAQDAAAEAVKRAAAAAVQQGQTGAEVAAAISGEKAALAAATAAYEAQVAAIARLRASLAAVREATAEEAKALELLHRAFQQGTTSEAAFINAQAATANREAAGAQAARAAASLGQQATASREAAVAARELAEAQAREDAEAERLRPILERNIAAKKALAEANARLAASEVEASEKQNLFKDAAAGISGVVATYVGLYQAIDAIKGAFQTATDYEAAQVRVTQALGGSSEAGAAAFQHVIDKATALKVNALEAADNFGKFAAAVKGTAIEGEQTARIFDALLKIQRGFKLDDESIQRGTIALRDLGATGQVTLRYLNQFDRAVPVGLLSELSKAAGFGTGEISKFLKAVHDGQVGLETLAPALEAVAGRIDKNLDSALKTSQSSLADFKNAFVQAQVAFTNGGFLDAAIQGLNTLTEVLRSDAGKAGLRDLGTLVGNLLRAIAAVIPYARDLLAVFVAIGAYKGTIAFFDTLAGGIPIIQRVKAAYAEYSAAQAVAAAQAEAAAAAIAAGEVEVGAAAAAAAAPVGLFGAVLAALGGPLGAGLLLAAGAAAFVLFGGNASRAGDATTDFNRVLDQLKEHSDAAAGSVHKTAEELAALAQVDIDKAILSQRDAIAETAAELRRFSDAQRVTKATHFFSGQDNADLNAIQDLAQAVAAGGLTVDEVKAKFQALYDTIKDPTAREHLLAEKDAFDKYAEQVTKLAALAQASNGKSKLGGVEEDAKKAKGALEDVIGKIKEMPSGISAVTEAQEKLDAAMEKLKGVFPSIKTDLKELSDEAKIAAANFAAIKLDEAAAKADGMGGGIGGIGPFKNENFDATQLKISEAQQKTLQERFEKLPGFSEQIQNLSTRVFGAESGGSGDPNHARSSTGALGQGQFLASTFIEQFKKAFGNDTGLSNEQIAALRTNGALSQQLGKQYLLEQGTALATVGNKPGFNFEGRAYLGYNAGIPAATRLLNADPNSSARAAVGATVADANPSYYNGKTVQQALDKIEQIVGQGAKLNNKGQTPIENRDEQITKIFDKSVRDLESKTKAAGDGKDNDKRGQYVAQQGQKFTDEALAKNTEAAGKEVKELTKEQQKQLAIIKEKATAEYNATHKDEDEKAKLEELTTLTERRKVALEELASAEKKGDTSKIDEYKKKVAELTEQIKKTIPEAKKMVDALGDQKGTLKLEQTQAALDDVKKSSDDAGKSIANDFAGDATSAIEGFVSDISKGKNAMDALKDAFLKFASSFLKQIAEMILKKALLGAIGGNPDSKGSAQSGGIFSGIFGGGGGGGGGLFGGGGGGGIFGMLGGLFHEGGMVGSTPLMTRAVDPAWFINAPRFHEGGFPGLQPSEVPIIAQKGERVLTAAQQRGDGRMAAGSPQPMPQRNILVMGDSEVAAAMAGSHGEQVTLSHIKRNASTISKMVK